MPDQASYLGIFLMLVLTGMGLPIPEEVPIVLAGIGAAYHRLDPTWAYLTTVAGAVVGDCIMYAIGYYFGLGILQRHPWCAKLFHAERHAKVLAMFDKHGLKVLFFARFLVGIRGPVYLSAGILRVPFRKFLPIDLLAGTAVTGLFFFLSYKYSHHIESLLKHVKEGQRTLTLAVVVACAVGALFWWRHHRKVVREAAAAAEATLHALPESAESAAPAESAVPAESAEISAPPQEPVSAGANDPIDH